MRSVTASAPAKVILFGEHFVVKGALGIVAAIDLRARVSVREDRGDSVVVRSRGIGGKYKIALHNPMEAPKPVAPFARILSWLRKRGYTIYPAIVEINSDIPVGAGLGSSAATAAAFTLSYTTLHGDALRPRELVEATMEAEVEAHGRPSGIDPNIVVYGGILAYKPGSDPISINSKLSREEYRLVVADSGLKRDTRVAVESVLKLASRYNRVLDHVYKAADELSKLAVVALENGDARMLGELMNINHGLLSAIGVSRPELEELVYRARRAGALGSKITGAGLGGSVIALCYREGVESVILELAVGASWVSQVGFEYKGVLIE